MLNIQKEIEIISNDIVNDIETLVKIPSIRDLQSATVDAPFGNDIKTAFQVFGRLAKQKGFLVKDFSGYAMHASTAEGNEYIGVLAHLDVVEAGDIALWNSDPFKMKVKDGMLYGRGVNDDKGPLIAVFYATYLLIKQKLPMKYPIRLIVGGAEETTWECMNHYFLHNKQPICGFSPDGNFPIVNGEKGILQVSFSYPEATSEIHIYTEKRLNYVCDKLIVELPLYKDRKFIHHANIIEKTSTCLRVIYNGKTALSRNPQKGENALFHFVKDFLQCTYVDENLKNMIQMLHEQFEDDNYGIKSGLYAEDIDMGTTSVCPMSLNWHDDIFELCLDIRYTKSTNEKHLMKRASQIAIKYKANVSIIRHKRLLYVDPNSVLIKSLKQAYYKVMKEDAATLSKGGASYARVLDQGVAFGATFPNEDPCVHMPNEHMSISSLLKACEIYYEALYLLAVDHDKL